MNPNIYDETKKNVTKTYKASGNLNGGKKLHPIESERYKPKPDEVLIERLSGGVCDSYLQQVHIDWKHTIYPCVPGHGIIGKVIGKRR